MTNEGKRVFETAVNGDRQGCRLDKALRFLVPGTSLRRARRLIERGAVLVNGRVERAAKKVAEGDRIRIVAEKTGGKVEIAGFRLVERVGGYAALYKPGGVHSAHVTASGNPSVEGSLGDLFPGESPILLNRLDLPTSGILLVAFSEEDKRGFRELEHSGRVEKTYLALSSQPLPDPGQAEARRRLDADGGSSVQIIGEDDFDPLRWTRLENVREVMGGGAWLIRARIHRGARHQIRAHMAWLGRPILGDSIYGGREGIDVRGGLYLHHGHVRFPGFEATALPDWPEIGLDRKELARALYSPAPG